MTKTESYVGANCTGDSGSINRVLTLSNTRLTRDDGLHIIVSGLHLHDGDFNISHKNSSSTITFLNALFDDQPISISYEVVSYGITEEYTGADATGSDGGLNRVLTLSNIRTTVDGGFYVIINGVYLTLTTDYTVTHNSSGSTITFLNALFNDQPIIIIYVTTGAEGIIPLDIASISNEISYFGTSVALRVITDSSYSKWGDPAETTSDTTKVAVVQVLSQEDQLVKEGIFQSGDKLFWFKGDETNIARGNRIRHNALWYEIVEVLEHDAAGKTYIIESRTHKV